LGCIYYNSVYILYDVFPPSKAYKEQLKRDSVVTAKAIINNDNVKVRYERYMKVTTFVAY